MNDSRCVVCSDEGVPMTVVTVDPRAGLARCVATNAQLSGESATVAACPPAEVMIGLIDDVRPGDLLLVHAGTALLRLEPAGNRP